MDEIEHDSREFEEWQLEALRLFKGSTTVREVADAIGKPVELVGAFFGDVVRRVAHDMQRDAGWM